MKTIKINFSGMGGNFDPQNNFIITILKRHYQVELSQQPEYLFYSVNSDDHLNYDCVKIYYTAENLVPDFNLCDYGIGFHYLQFDDRYMRYPIYLVESFVSYAQDDYATDLKRAMEKHLSAVEYAKQKEDFCAYVYSNAEAAPCRARIFQKLSEYQQVHSGGRYQNNIGGAVENKLTFQTKHKFAIAFENTLGEGYTTEKLIQAFAAGTIPIYWGNPAVAKECNEKAFINCHSFGLKADTPLDSPIYDAILAQVKYLDENEDAYLAMLSEPAFAQGYDIQAQQLAFEQFLCNIFDQEPQDAYRRNRSYWGERYLRKMRIGMKFYWQLRKIIPIRDAIKKIFR